MLEAVVYLPLVIGFMVPYWKEANETAKKLALHNTDIHYASLDLAFTENG